MSANGMDIAQDVLAAETRIRPHLNETSLVHSSYYSELGGANVYLKLENLQPTGSFKVRGALNKVLSLSDAERAGGIVTASSGNHGAAVALALSKTGAKGIVFVPEHASSAKVANIKRLGAEVRFFGDDSAVTESHARQYAADNGATFISPYNDREVAAGQGTLAVELFRQLDCIDAIFIALGGGGLVGGIAAHVRSVAPATRVYAVSPENSKVMIESVKTNRILDLPSQPTLSDGTAGGVEPGSITFELCRDLVDEYVTVTEEEIAEALKEFMAVEHMLIEGAAAVTVAAYLKHKQDLDGKNVVVVICGANIALDVLKSVL